MDVPFACTLVCILIDRMTSDTFKFPPFDPLYCVLIPIPIQTHIGIGFPVKHNWRDHIDYVFDNDLISPNVQATFVSLIILSI